MVAVVVAVTAHSRVGQLSDVPCPNAAGVDNEVVCNAPFIHHVFHDAIGGWRAAYITETYEENFFFHRVVVFLSAKITKTSDISV